MSPRECLFIAEYIKCLNASEAYRRAGYTGKNADACSSAIKNKPEVKAEIDRLVAEKLLSSGETLGILSDQARATIEDFIDLGVNEERIAEIDEQIAATKKLMPDCNKFEELIELQKQINELSILKDRYSEQDYRINLQKAEKSGKLPLIKGMKPTKYGLSLELHDAQAAAVKIGTHHKLFTEQQVLNGDIRIIVERKERSPSGSGRSPSGADESPEGGETL